MGKYVVMEFSQDIQGKQKEVTRFVVNTRMLYPFTLEYDVGKRIREDEELEMNPRPGFRYMKNIFNGYEIIEVLSLS
jgi:hypothetical protein